LVLSSVINILIMGVKPTPALKRKPAIKGFY